MHVYLNTLGLWAPGLAGWRDSLPVLTGAGAGGACEAPPLNPTILPPNERRRSTRTIKLALQVAQEAMEQSNLPAEQVCTVFASSDGDLELADRIIRALCLPDHPVSPTDFHNSVNNAAAGYWAIATASHMPSTMVSAERCTFSAGLLEAAVLANSEHAPVLLVAYDSPTPDPISTVHCVDVPFAAAMLLSPQPGAESRWRLGLSLVPGEARQVGGENFEKLLAGNPIAACLPLLQTIAHGGEGVLMLPYLSGSQLAVEVAPC